MKLLPKSLIYKLKKYIDKLYYNKYTHDRETLIREMFPNIENIWEYKHIDFYLRNSTISQTNDLVKAIWAFYWWEVARLTKENKYDEIMKYQWLIDFSQTIKDYHEYVLTENIK
jgi:hypothetical protein